MTPKRFMLIAGETSGDVLAAELVRELRAGIQRQSTYSHDRQPLQADLAPRFFGAGGPRMAEAGVELAFDLTRHSVIGLVLKDYFKFRRLFNQLLKLAIEQEPHVIICVDFSLFNHWFAAAIKRHVRRRRGVFNNWEPKIVKYISPQVWASRENRVYQIARDFDLLLSIIPFEQAWYAARVPKLPVEFVGHPMIDRHAPARNGASDKNPARPLVLLLPGSRKGELKRHLPVMLEAFDIMCQALPSLRGKMILPNEEMAAFTHAFLASSPVKSRPEIQTGGLAESLKQAAVAIAKTGTVTMECALFGVPTATMYKTSWSTYQLGKRLVKIKSVTMPNLLAGEQVFPEFIQDAATPDNLATAALELLRDQTRRETVQAKLAQIIASLGGPGASQRAAQAVLKIMG